MRSGKRCAFSLQLIIVNLMKYQHLQRLMNQKRPQRLRRPQALMKKKRPQRLHREWQRASNFLSSCLHCFRSAWFKHACNSQLQQRCRLRCESFPSALWAHGKIFHAFIRGVVRLLVARPTRMPHSACLIWDAPCCSRHRLRSNQTPGAVRPGPSWTLLKSALRTARMDAVLLKLGRGKGCTEALARVLLLAPRTAA